MPLSVMTNGNSRWDPARPAAPVQALRLRTTCETCGQAFTVKVNAQELAGAHTLA